jgi:Spy/CpxP family protein refolding chaperone
MHNKFCTVALSGLLAIGMAGTAALAQDSAPPQSQPMQGEGGPSHRQMDPDKQLKHMTKTLDLTSDQQTQIKPILVNRDQQMQQLWQDQSTPREERRTKMEAIRQDTKSKIEAVLNDTQKQKYEQMEQQHSRGQGGPNGQGAAAQPPQ